MSKNKRWFAFTADEVKKNEEHQKDARFTFGFPRRQPPAILEPTTFNMIFRQF